MQIDKLINGLLTDETESGFRLTLFLYENTRTIWKTNFYRWLFADSSNFEDVEVGIF